jgi:integrase
MRAQVPTKRNSYKRCPIRYGSRYERGRDPRVRRANEKANPAFRCRSGSWRTYRLGDDARYAVEWGGYAVRRVDKTISLIAEEVGLGHVTPDVLRHTAATWQVQSGTDLFEAGRYLRMIVRTLESTYAHHCPEHLTSARDAYQRHRQRYTVNGTTRRIGREG